MKKLNEYIIVNGKPEKVYSARPTKIINEEIIRLNELAGLKEAEEEENPNWTAGIDPETGKPATREEIEAKAKKLESDLKSKNAQGIADSLSNSMSDKDKEELKKVIGGAIAGKTTEVKAKLFDKGLGVIRKSTRPDSFLAVILGGPVGMSNFMANKIANKIPLLKNKREQIDKMVDDLSPEIKAAVIDLILRKVSPSAAKGPAGGTGPTGTPV